MAWARAPSGDVRQVIVLDTNVLSELMRSKADPAVVTWLDRQPAQSVWTTSITLFELEFGIEILPEGARKDSLAHKFDQLVDSLLERRVLDFDRASARAAAVIAGRLRSIGRRGEIADLQIAGIVSARKGLLATRNMGHFEHSEIALVDPWR